MASWHLPEPAELLRLSALQVYQTRATPRLPAGTWHSWHRSSVLMCAFQGCSLRLAEARLAPAPLLRVASGIPSSCELKGRPHWYYCKGLSEPCGNPSGPCLHPPRPTTTAVQGCLVLRLREGCFLASSPGKLCPPPCQGPNAVHSSLFSTPTLTA